MSKQASKTTNFPHSFTACSSSVSGTIQIGRLMKTIAAGLLASAAFSLSVEEARAWCEPSSLFRPGQCYSELSGSSSNSSSSNSKDVYFICIGHLSSGRFAGRKMCTYKVMKEIDYNNAKRVCTALGYPIIEHSKSLQNFPITSKADVSHHISHHLHYKKGWFFNDKAKGCELLSNKFAE